MKQITSALIIIFFAGCYGVTPQKTGKEGQPIPEFSILLTDSTTWINTHNIPSGKPIGLFYFSPNCPYCKAQTQEIIEEMDDLRNIQFYFISNSPLPNIKAFQKTYHLSKYPNIITALDTSNFVKKYFNAPGIPYLAIYGKNKNLNNSFLGHISANQIKKTAEE